MGKDGRREEREGDSSKERESEIGRETVEGDKRREGEGGKEGAERCGRLRGRQRQG